MLENNVSLLGFVSKIQHIHMVVMQRGELVGVQVRRDG